MPLGPSDSPMLVWVCACMCMRVSPMQRLRGVGRDVILSQWRWTHCVSSCRLLLMLLSYNSLLLALSVAHWSHSCHYLPRTRAGGANAPLQLRLSVHVWMCAYVCVFLMCVCVLGCFLPALTAHHGAPAEHCCISASLGLSPGSSKRPDPAGNGLGPENRKKGEKIVMEEDVKQDSVKRRKKRWKALNE